MGREIQVTRFAGWLITGPVGHLVAGALDWVTLFGGYVWARARGRAAWKEPWDPPAR
jgi:hypothetical protein